MKKKAPKKLAINSVSPALNLILSLIISLMGVITLAPILLVISISVSSGSAISQNGYQFWPSEFSVDAYKYLIKVGDTMWRAYGNTIFYTVFGTVLSLFVMSMFAYTLSRKDLKGRTFLAFFTYFTTLFGGGLVPGYILMTRYLQIDNTIWVFILPGLVSAFHVIMLRTFIQTTIHDSLLESAKLDGANEYQVYFWIVLPLFKAGLATIGLFGVVSRWNDWFTGMLYANKEKTLQPIMTFLQMILNNFNHLKQNSAAAATAEGMRMLKELPTESTQMAITIIAILPLLVCYPFFQKYFIKGLTVGSVKG